MTCVVEVPLTRGMVAIIDEEDIDLVFEHQWHVNPNKNHTLFYAKSSTGGFRTSMHRLIIGAPPAMKVDHIDGDGLNNRKTNIRLCTNQQNSFNKKNYRGRYKGVTSPARYQGRARPFVAQIRHNDKQMHIGVFGTEEEAAIAYDEVALRLFGDFAKLNFQKGG